MSTLSTLWTLVQSVDIGAPHGGARTPSAQISSRALKDGPKPFSSACRLSLHRPAPHQDERNGGWSWMTSHAQAWALGP